MWDFVFGAASDVIMHITVAVIVLTVIISAIVAIIVKVKNLDEKVTKIVNNVIIALQAIWLVHGGVNRSAVVS